MPPLQWSDIRNRAIEFSRSWADATSERAEAKTFLDEFLGVFGVHRRRVASFERKVHQTGDRTGFIDLLWPGLLLIEQKSAGKNLDRAYQQAREYFHGLADHELPRYILVSNFQRFRLYDLEDDEHWEFGLDELAGHLKLFGFIAGYEPRSYREQDPVNLQAAESMGLLHDQLKASGYIGHDLEVLLVRLLFCLFADDTGIFNPQGIFMDYLESKTAIDGSDLGPKLHALFEVLNTPPAQRLTTLDEDMASLPYVNGRLFGECLRVPGFDRRMREQLLKCCALNWSGISPAIFGALFQSVMDPKARRNLGAHYTSEQNILKVIEPLFLDELRAEFEKVKRSPAKLRTFHNKLRSLRFMDPACGCGNFLVIAYRELRELELALLRVQHGSGRGAQLELNIDKLVLLDVDQFFGIEIEEFPAQIAQVALWLMDHQMNTKAGAEFGQWFARIPLETASTILHANACEVSWSEIVPAEQMSYVFGNPPFVGGKMMDAKQRRDAERVFLGVRNAGLLDYVCCWYLLAARYTKGTAVRCAFVSTNSITQGEQVGVLWDELLQQGINIHFAHRTFAWTSEARGAAAVHCVIIGFGHQELAGKVIYDYEDPKGPPLASAASTINPYLVDGPNITIKRRSSPICDCPEIGIGNKPIDGGYYLFTESEMQAFVQEEPGAKKWFRPWIGADELINGYQRWCLWLKDCPPEELRRMPLVLQRVQAVRDFRLASRSESTRALAATPTSFHVENFSSEPYLVFPGVSSERRRYIPVAYLPPDTLASNLLYVTRKATLFHFGILTSSMQVAWLANIGGRLESRYRFSKDIVYNNFPWPVDATAAQQAAIESAAQSVLDARAAHPGASLADLYDPLTMPVDLQRAHQLLDKAVDKAYKLRGTLSDTQRVAFLLERYLALTSLMPPPRPAGRSRTRRTATS
ncbi:MAG: hypothetical protein GEEBNDBF_00036 [bacterium]|nr:hypothetical protein [bacterium]